MSTIPYKRHIRFQVQVLKGGATATSPKPLVLFFTVSFQLAASWVELVEMRRVSEDNIMSRLPKLPFFRITMTSFLCVEALRE